MIAELSQHRAGELARLERLDRLLELGDEAPLRSLAQITAVRAGHRVHRLALGDILELRSTGDLRAQRIDTRAHRRAVRGRYGARDREHAHCRPTRALEVRLVRV